MATPQIVAGDDVSLIVALKKNGASFNIPTNADVKAMLVGALHQTALTAEVAQAHTTPGADWTQSIVVVVFAAVDTASISVQGPALLEIQVSDGKKTTWFVPVQIVKGYIA